MRFHRCFVYVNINTTHEAQLNSHIFDVLCHVQATTPVHKSKTKMKEFAIGVATVTIGVTVGYLLAKQIEKMLAK